jgi:nucleoside-diphosphate-sugar epimerase
MSYECDLTDAKSVKNLIDLYEPDTIFAFHGCATVSSPPDKIWIANVDTTFNLLQYAPKDCRFILASSLNAAHAKTVYASSKIASEALVECYSRQKQIKGTSVRLCAVAGAGNSHGVVKAVVDKFMDKSTDKVQLLTDSEKPFLYVVDAAQKIVSLVETGGWKPGIGEVLNLCPYGNMYVSEIVSIVRKLTSIDKEASFTKQSWQGDDDIVVGYQDLPSQRVFGKIDSSPIAVEKAVKDILEQEYGVKVKA